MIIELNDIKKYIIKIIYCFKAPVISTRSSLFYEHPEEAPKETQEKVLKLLEEMEKRKSEGKEVEVPNLFGEFAKRIKHLKEEDLLSLYDAIRENRQRK